MAANPPVTNPPVTNPPAANPPTENATSVLEKYNQLPHEERLKVNGVIGSQFQAGYVGHASQRVVDYIWKTIITVFVAILVLSAVALVCTIWIPIPKDAHGDAQTILTIFSTIVGFLAGVLTPSPMTSPNQQPANGNNNQH